MFKTINQTPMIRLLIPYSTGILIKSFCYLTQTISWYLFVITVSIAIGLNMIHQRSSNYKYRWLSGFWIQIAFLSAGIYATEPTIYKTLLPLGLSNFSAERNGMIRFGDASGLLHLFGSTGLSVGFIVICLVLLFPWINRKPFRKNWMLFFMLLVIWTSTFLFGFSYSLVRASIVFSFIIIGQLPQRPSHIRNPLAGSALIILLINPENLFDTGFQVFYASIIGGVFLSRIIYKIITVKGSVPENG